MKKSEIVLLTKKIMLLGFILIFLTNCVPEKRNSKGIRVQELNINDNIYVVHSRFSPNGNKGTGSV